MRAPRRRTLRKGGRRAEAPFQGASAALSMATLAGAACVGRHELPCRHTAREFLLVCCRLRVPTRRRPVGHEGQRERERGLRRSAGSIGPHTMLLLYFKYLTSQEH